MGLLNKPKQYQINLGESGRLWVIWFLERWRENSSPGWAQQGLPDPMTKDENETNPGKIPAGLQLTNKRTIHLQNSKFLMFSNPGGRGGGGRQGKKKSTCRSPTGQLMFRLNYHKIIHLTKLSKTWYAYTWGFDRINLNWG